MNATNKTFGGDLFKSIGHETRTLLNTITGPVEIIRMYSDDSRLIDPLKILELSAYRFEKFSLRALLISDMLSENVKIENNIIDIVDSLKHIILELDGFLNFYQIQIGIQNIDDKTFVEGNLKIIYQSLEVIIEQALQLSPPESTIIIQGSSLPNELWTITIPDNGLLTLKFNEIINSQNLPNEIDLAFFTLASTSQQNVSYKFDLINKQSVVYMSIK